MLTLLPGEHVQQAFRFGVAVAHERRFDVKGRYRMATLHAMYKHSVTIHTDDLAVVNCLRALSELSQRTGNNRISWGGTKDRDWKRDT